LGLTHDVCQPREQTPPRIPQHSTFVVLHELEVVGQLSRKVSEVRRVADEALAAAADRINAMP